MSFSFDRRLRSEDRRRPSRRSSEAHLRNRPIAPSVWTVAPTLTESPGSTPRMPIVRALLLFTLLVGATPVARGPLFEVEEDGEDDGRVGQKREDPHLGAAGGTEQRQHVATHAPRGCPAREQNGPADGSPVAPSGRSSIVSRVGLVVRFAEPTSRSLGSGRGGALTRRLGGNGRCGGIPFGRRRLGPTEGHDARPQSGVGRQDAVVAMTVHSWGRDEGTDAKGGPAQ
jgi:hypothetical protein